MSRLYWHTRERTAELMGSEYHHLGHLAAGVAEAAWDFGMSDPVTRFAPIMALIPQHRDRGHGENYLHTEYRQVVAGGDQQRWLRSLRVRLAGRVSDEVFQLRPGITTSALDVSLNTALLAGSDAVRFAAKVWGLGEIHGYVEGDDRAWCAELIEGALDAAVYRRQVRVADGPDLPRTIVVDQGWGDVLALLREDDGPVVLSYSVTDGFPSREAAGWTTPLASGWAPEWARDASGRAEWAAMSEARRGEYRDEEIDRRWAALPDGQQWDLAVGRLRAVPWKRIGRDLARWSFGPHLTVYDLLADDRDARIAAAVAEAGGAGLAVSGL